MHKFIDIQHQQQSLRKQMFLYLSKNQRNGSRYYAAHSQSVTVKGLQEACVCQHEPHSYQTPKANKTFTVTNWLTDTYTIQ